MPASLRTFGAYALLLVFGLGGAVAPHVHVAWHAFEEAEAAHAVAGCDDATHSADLPVASAHFHEVEALDCVLCATTHLLTAVPSVADRSVPPAPNAPLLSPDRIVLRVQSYSFDIRGPPVPALPLLRGLA